MFENIAELEKEVQEFRKNILASTELVASLERLIAQTKKQSQTIESTTADLREAIQQQSADISSENQRAGEAHAAICKSEIEAFAEATQKLCGITEQHIQTIMGAAQRQAATLDKQAEHFDASMKSASAEQERVAKEQADRLAATTERLVQSITDQTAALTTHTDTLMKQQVAYLAQENQIQLTKALTALEGVSAAFTSTTKEMEGLLSKTQAELNQRYDQVIAKLEAANLSESVRLSKSILKSLNIKFAVLLTGTVASIVIAILAFLK